MLRPKESWVLRVRVSCNARVRGPGPEPRPPDRRDNGVASRGLGRPPRGFPGKAAAFRGSRWGGFPIALPHGRGHLSPACVGLAGFTLLKVATPASHRPQRVGCHTQPGVPVPRTQGTSSLVVTATAATNWRGVVGLRRRCFGWRLRLGESGAAGAGGYCPRARASRIRFISACSAESAVNRRTRCPRPRFATTVRWRGVFSVFSHP